VELVEADSIKNELTFTQQSLQLSDETIINFKGIIEADSVKIKQYNLMIDAYDYSDKLQKSKIISLQKTIKRQKTVSSFLKVGFVASVISTTLLLYTR